MGAVRRCSPRTSSASSGLAAATHPSCVAKKNAVRRGCAGEELLEEVLRIPAKQRANSPSEVDLVDVALVDVAERPADARGVRLVGIIGARRRERHPRAGRAGRGEAREHAVGRARVVGLDDHLPRHVVDAKHRVVA